MLLTFAHNIIIRTMMIIMMIIATIIILIITILLFFEVKVFTKLRMKRESNHYIFKELGILPLTTDDAPS